MLHDEIINADLSSAMHTYSRIPIVPERCSGATLTDYDGHSYIDFTSGIGVNSLGFCNPEWTRAVNDQLTSFAHISNYYYSRPTAELQTKLLSLTGMSRVFMCNSGAEANECAIKIARKYSFDKYGPGRHTIISMRNSFHGRTITTLAATGQDVFHTFFDPFTDGFEYIPFNDTEALNSVFSHGDICAVITEPIQGEGGVNLMDESFALQLRELCSKNDVLLIFDEVQTGIYRTGKLLCAENYGIIADITTLAKGLGGGLPIGCVLTGEKCANVLQPGQHGTTFGGNPVSCAGANAVLDLLSVPGVKEDINRKGEFIRSRVKEAGITNIKDIRGMGLMIGIAVDGDPKFYLHAAADAGLLVLTAGKNVIRLLPPLLISDEELESGIKILLNVLKQ